MPSIEDFNPAAYEPTPLPKKAGAAPTTPAQPAAGEPNQLAALMDVLSRIPQLQGQLAIGGAKELGRQATNLGQFTESIPPAIKAMIPGGLPAIMGSKIFPAVQRAILPPEQTQASFEPQGVPQERGALAARVGVPILASVATGGAASPLLAGAGAGGRIAATAGLEGVTGAATGVAQGEDPAEQGALAALFGGGGAAVGALKGGVKAAMAANTARKARNAGSPVQQANEALGVALKHVKEGQHPAAGVIEAGINLKAPPQMIDEQITLALDAKEQVKTTLARHLPPIPRAEIDKVLTEFGGPITALVGKVAKQVKKGELPVSTLDEIGDLQELLTTPGDIPALVADRARGNLRSLIERFAAGNKKKGVRKGLEDARKALGDLNPALKAANTDMANLIAARMAIRDKIAKLGVEGLPEQEPSTAKQIASLISRFLPFGKTGAIARGAARVIPD